jgi:homoserine kinase
MRARVPASSANLGPGFDSLALALALYVEVTVEEADRLEVVSSGEGADLPCGPDHLAARVATAVVGHDRLRIRVRSDIPVSRGLGSSAALAVAAAAAAGANDPFAWGVRVDGHPENAAASAFGGLVAATTVGRRPVWRHLPLDPELVLVAVVPRLPLATADARAVLGETVGRQDAVFNLGRQALLIAGLADHREMAVEAGDDRLHQDARASLFPPAPGLIDGLRRAGALTSFWSGAGPTLAGVCVRGRAPGLAEAAQGLVSEAGLDAAVLVLEPDRTGITLSRPPAH